MNISKLSIILSGFAVLFGVVAIFTSRPYNYELDHIGFIVAVLVCIITLLIGWNIYTVIDVKDKIERSTEIEEKIKDAISKNEANWQYDLSICSRLFTMTSNALPSERIANYLKVFHYSRKDLLIGKSYTRELILCIVENTYQFDITSFHNLAVEISKDEEISSDVVSSFYKDYSSMSDNDKLKYRHVEVFLSDLISTISKNHLV